MLKLDESSELAKGIFWVKDIDNVSDSLIYFDIPCDTEGNVTSHKFQPNAKSCSVSSLTWYVCKPKTIPERRKPISLPPKVF